MAESAHTVLFTDGACIGNPGPGGWAWASDEGHYASGAETHTTNQRMEVRAALEALLAVPDATEIVSDSTYVVNCFRNRWWATWRAKGWKNARGQAVANRDLWEPLISEVVDHRKGAVTFTWVRGHNGDRMNEFVDSLANMAARSQEPASSISNP